MAEKSIDSSLAKPTEVRIKDTIIDIYPIRIKDWPEASKLVWILDFESLADLSAVGGLNDFDTLMRIAARTEERENNENLAILKEAVDADFKWIKQLLIAQNDINMERLLAKINKISERKNAATPVSRLQTE